MEENNKIPSWRDTIDLMAKVVFIIVIAYFLGFMMVEIPMRYGFRP